MLKLKLAIVFVLKPGEYEHSTWPKKHADLPSVNSSGFRTIMLRNVAKKDFSPPPQVAQTAADTATETNILATEIDSTTFLNEFIREYIQRTSLGWTSACRIVGLNTGPGSYFYEI